MVVLYGIREERDRFMTTMAKKRRNNMIFAFSVIIILVALLIVVKITSKEEEDIVTEDVSYKICSITTNQFSKVTYEYSDGAVVNYVKEANAWKNADDEKFPLSSSAFENQFVSVFAEFTSNKKITEYEDKSIFGLDKPLITVTITANNGGVVKYYLGSYNASIDEYYLMIDGDDSIYTISTDFQYICRKDIYDYATVDSFPKYNINTLDYLEFKGGNISVQLLYRPDGLEEDFIGSTTWYIASPFGRIRPCEDSRMDTLADEIIAGLVYSKTVNYKATKQDLEDYGLATPVGSYSIHFTYTDENGNESPAIKTVYIGKQDTDTTGYFSREVLIIGLAKEESNVVRMVDKFTAESIMGIDPLDYIYMNVAYVLLDDIKDSNITFSTTDKEYKFEYNDVVVEDKTKEVYKLNGDILDTTSFKDFYYNFTSLRPERVISDKTKIKDGEVVYKIIANRTKDDYFGKMTLEFRVYDNTYYQVTLNEVTDILVNKRHVDNLFKEIEEMKKAE